MLQLPESAFVPTNIFAKIKCEPTWNWPKRDKPLVNYDLFYVWEGTGEVFVNDQSFAVGKGSCFLFRPGDFTHAVHQPKHPLVITYIHFNLQSKPERVPARYRALSETVHFETLLSRYIHLRLSPLFGSEEEATLILKQLLIVLLRSDRSEGAEARKISKDRRDRILETANYIREHPAAWPRIDELAARAQLSPRHYAVRFKEVVGTSTQEYAIRCRIERAAFLLHYGGMTVTEAAGALGYSDVYFFSKQFKKYTGQSPSSFKES